MQSISTIVRKLIKVSESVQRKFIPYRSNVGSGHFERLNILEIFQESSFQCIGI